MRTVVWFSCGAASAVAAKLAVDTLSNVFVVYCDTLAEEHPDNARFLGDVEKWIGRPVSVIRSSRYATISDVFEQTRYMSGVAGARCTVEMKKVPRYEFQKHDDVHVFGYTLDEQKRIEVFVANNPELTCSWVLRDAGITKARCYQILQEAGIALPAMYALGFKNNNCIGCVKATSPAYWERVRLNFPDVFAKRARQSREIGARLVRVDGQRVFLDEMPTHFGNEPTLFGEEDIECGPICTTGSPDA